MTIRLQTLGRCHRHIMGYFLGNTMRWLAGNWDRHTPLHRELLGWGSCRTHGSKPPTESSVILSHRGIMSDRQFLTFCANGRATHGEKNGPRIRTTAIGATMKIVNIVCRPEPN